MSSTNTPTTPNTRTATSLRIKPFAALRPEPLAAARVASVPYDVVNTAEARDLASGNPDSFLHIIRPEIDLPSETSPYADVVYETATHNLKDFEDRGVLVREESEHIYLYRQEADLVGNAVSQTGVVCCCHIDDYAGDLIKKHEKTRQDKEDDRTRHVQGLSANAEPVFFLHNDSHEIEVLTKQAVDASDQLFDFTAPDGVRHTIWRVPSEMTDAITAAFAQLPCAYVADGHHRTAAAARAGAERRAANPNHTGSEEYNWFLTVLFPAGQLSILPYHRVVKDLNGLSPEQLLGRLRKICSVESTNDPSAPASGTVCMYLPGASESESNWHLLTFAPESIDRNDPIGSLDYEILAQRVLHTILGVGDIRTDKRIDFVGGIRGTQELERRVDSGEMAVAFSMFPVSIDQLIAVADAGAIMPPKCTWFEPKLRSGLLVHTLE